MELHAVIKHPLSTEKSIRLMESENKLIFIVDRRANKEDIKKAMEERFKVKIEKINTSISTTGQKKAYIKLRPDFPAIDVATKLGLM